MTDAARDAAFRAFAIAAVQEALSVEYKAAKAAARELFPASGDRLSLRLPDGTEVGSATLPAAKKDHVRITDPDAWVRHVAKHHPEHLKVEYAYERSYLGRLVVDGADVIDPHTGQAVDFAAVVPAAEVPPSLRLTPAKNGGKARVIEALRRGDLAALDLITTPTELPPGGAA